MPSYARGERVPRLGVYQFSMAEPSEESDLLTDDDDDDDDRPDQTVVTPLVPRKKCRRWFLVVVFLVLGVLVAVLSLALVLEAVLSWPKETRFPEKPPMGWTSALIFPCDAVSSHLARQMVKELEDKHLRDSGYTYVLVDGCWQGSRNKSGYLQPKGAFRHPTTSTGVRTGFSEMISLGRWLKGEKFKFGLSTGLGAVDCHGNVGSVNHEKEDVETFIKWWRVSYIKAESCHLPTETNSSVLYEKFSKMVEATQKQIILNANSSLPITQKQGFVRQVVPWVPLHDWEDIIGVVDQYVNDKLWLHTGPGSWNDMGPLGRGPLTTDEFTAQFVLWCAMKSQLFIGSAVRDNIEIQLLMNGDLININQDKLGEAVRPVYQNQIPQNNSQHQIVSKSCMDDDLDQQWFLNKTTKQVVHKKSNLCLTLDKFDSLYVRKCNMLDSSQKWMLSQSEEKDLLHIQPNSDPVKCVTTSTHQGAGGKVRACSQRKGTRNWSGPNQPWHGFNDAFIIKNKDSVFSVKNSASLCASLGGTMDYQIFAGRLSDKRHVIIFHNRDIMEHNIKLEFKYLHIHVAEQFELRELVFKLNTTSTTIHVVKKGVFAINVPPHSVKVFTMVET